jgi:hypothetical protein
MKLGKGMLAFKGEVRQSLSVTLFLLDFEEADDEDMDDDE